jgi:antitoxin component YwqK of YwqJK toxin-antitoxin module
MTAPINQKDTQGNRHGLWKIHWESGEIYMIKNYHHGKRHGLIRKYFKGRVVHEFTYRHGDLYGLSKIYQLNFQSLRKRYYIKVK